MRLALPWRAQPAGNAGFPAIPAAIRLVWPFLAYLGLSLLLFDRPPHSLSGSILGWGADPYGFIWSLSWWPWAIAHGHNPFITHLVWYPVGLNLTWATSVPTLAALALPVTLLAGPVVSFNLLTLLAPAVDAYAGFLLARAIVGRTGPAILAGYLYGFSTYVVAQLLGHLNLDWACVPPLLVLCFLRRASGAWSRRRFTLTTAALLVAQLGISTEVLATSLFFGACSCLVFVVCSPRYRRSLIATGAETVLSAAIAVAATLPFWYYLIRGASGVPHIINSPETFSSDLLNFIIPTPITRIGRSVFTTISRQYTGNTSEQTAYLGIPLVLVMTAFFAESRTRWISRPLLIVVALLAVCSLGPRLWVNGVMTGVPMPWLAMTHVPGLRQALPGRFTLYVALAASVIAALWLSSTRDRPGFGIRLGAVAIACLMLIPNTGLGRWLHRPTVAFFTPDRISGYLHPGENVLVLPFGWTGPSMLWQADSGMYFTQSGGYLGFAPKPFRGSPIVQSLLSGRPGRGFAARLHQFSAENGVEAILAGPGTPPPLIAAFRAAGWFSRRTDGVEMFSLPNKSSARSADGPARPR